MTWKRALLIVGAALLLWQRPWRRLLRGSAPDAGSSTQPTQSTQSALSGLYAQPATAPVEGDSPGNDVMGIAGAMGLAPASAASELAAIEAPTGAESAVVPPEEAFIGSPVEALPSDADLDAALDLDDEQETIPGFGAEPEPLVETSVEEDSRPGSVDVPTGDIEPDAELEPELLELGEPEPVEMAEDDLMDIEGVTVSSTQSERADLGAVAQSELTEEVPPAQSQPADAGAPAQSQPASRGEQATAVSSGKPDDLLVIEGIGPRVSTIVSAAGFTTFAELAAADVDRLRTVLTDAGIKTIDPSTWPEQARIAADGRWDELKELQRSIKNGKKG